MEADYLQVLPTLLPHRQILLWRPFHGLLVTADLGAHALTFSATDNNGIQILLNITINVTLAPVFDVPPTPAQGVHIVVSPGTLISYTVKATDPDPNDSCRITNAQGKNMLGNPIALYPGASMNPVLPSPWGNSSQSIFSWTPTGSQWGHRHVFFTATDGYGDNTVHEVSQLVNTPPAFNSQAPTSACVGQKLTYHVKVMDPDTAYGDTVWLYGTNVPSWLTFVDSGNGRGSLCGTPSAGDVGPHNVIIQAQDVHHHNNGTAMQNFNVSVSNCGNQQCVVNNVITVPPINSIFINAGANLPNTYYWGLSGGMRVRANPSGGVGPYTYSWTSKSGYTVKAANKKTCKLWYPTGPGWMKVTITDVGANCSVMDSVWIDWVDLSGPCAPPGQIWYYEMCVNQVTTCVHTYSAMVSAVLGGATFGPCGNKNQSATIAGTDFGMSLFPNPNDGEFTLILDNAEGSVQLEVFDLHGRVLYTENLTNTGGLMSESVQLYGLEPGMYILKASDAKGSTTEKIQIN